MDKKILNKLIKNGAVSRILNKAFINGMEMLMKDVSALEGGNTNAKKNSHTNANVFNQNDYSSSNIRSKSAGRDSKTGSTASLAQIKYLRYLIFLLSKHYPNSSYRQITKEICSKNSIKGINTNCISKAKAYHLIKNLKSLLPTTNKPASKASAGLPF